MDIFIKSAKKIRIDGAIGYSSLARIIQAGGGVFTVFFIGAYLSKEEQGFYYTFGSILALQLFFELGLGGIIIQYVAYEAAHLKFDNNLTYTGNNEKASRMASLFKMFFRWYSFASILFLLAVGGWGIYFFKTNSPGTNVNWEIPWILLCIVTAINLACSLPIAFIEGIGQVKSIAKMRMFVQIISILCVWLVLICGGKLYATPTAGIVTMLFTVGYILFHYRFYFYQLWREKIENRISYKAEIFPYQWRIALSWISGYFIFQLFNPVLFAYCGAEVAGQMGMTLTALNGIFSLTLSWTSTKVPLWSKLISLKDYTALNLSYRSNLTNSSIICISTLILFWCFLGGVSLLRLNLYHRFLPLWLSIILGSTIFINNIINMWATYLRCFKKEPFLIQAVIVGVLSALSTILCGKYIGINGVVIVYTFIVTFISFPLSYYLFITNKAKYQCEQ